MSTLIHLFPMLFFVVLAGCYSDQRQQLAVCKMELRGKVFSAKPEIQAKAATDEVSVGVTRPQHTTSGFELRSRQIKVHSRTLSACAAS